MIDGVAGMKVSATPIIPGDIHEMLSTQDKLIVALLGTAVFVLIVTVASIEIEKEEICQPTDVPTLEI